MKKLWQNWDRFFFRAFDSYSLSVFRIFLGGFLVVLYLSYAQDWTEYFAASGYRSLIDPRLGDRDNVFNLFYWMEWASIPTVVLWWVALATSVSLFVGFQTRFSLIVQFLIQVSIIHRNHMVVNGEDLVLRMLLLYAMFLPLGTHLSIDAGRRKSVRFGLPRIWPLRLLQINILCIYVFSLPMKLALDTAWLNGEGMYWGLVNAAWSRWPWPEMSYGAGLWIKLLTWMALIVETLFPILVWNRKTVTWAVFVMSVFHLTISVVLESVTFFSLSMVLSFIVFLPPDFSRRQVHRVREWFRSFPALEWEIFARRYQK